MKVEQMLLLLSMFSILISVMSFAAAAYITSILREEKKAHEEYRTYSITFLIQNAKFWVHQSNIIYSMYIEQKNRSIESENYESIKDIQGYIDGIEANRKETINFLKIWEQ